ncbi:MAG: Histidine-tRNA ligase [candidate division TM6 bacterium GW2011_GWE2_41_16]|nr:MAG: Histidine-tRNA ligase [candidate division TM6 bacterium GW2011_GWE2_41_16]
MTPRVKGTQDFADMTLFNRVVDAAKTACAMHSFKEVATPILEHAELFHHSLGETSDVVTKEMFMIQMRNEEKLPICLRPELTAPIMRMFMDQSQPNLPWKVFSYGPTFRYERPQKGRFRQFHQFSIEAIGASSILYDVELLVLLEKLFSHTLGLSSFALLINFLGCSDDRVRFSSQLKTFLDQHEHELCPTCKTRKETNMLRVFDCKESSCQAVYTNAPKTIDFLCETCAVEWQALKDNLEALSVSYSVMPTLVRGLDYYTKTVFEFSSMLLGAQSAFCGGGRYDRLGEILGSKQMTPACGAGIGIERVMALLELQKNVRDERTNCIAIAPLDVAQHTLALLVQDDLRAHHIPTYIIFDATGPKQAIKKADRSAARYAVILGEDEQKNGCGKLKDMTSGEEELIVLSQLAQKISSLLKA